MNPVIEAWIVIEKLAALVNTPGIDDTNKQLANEQIQKLLSNVISPSLTKLSAHSSGIVGV